MEEVYMGISATGEGEDTRVCDIAVVDGAGTALIHTLINPGVRISSEASRRHGLTALQCSRSPSMRQIEFKLMEIVRGKDLIVWGKPAVMNVLTGFIISSAASIECCQFRFSEYYGEFRDTAVDSMFEIMSMDKAMEELGLSWAEDKDQAWVDDQHRALPRAKVCRFVWQYLNDVDSVMNWTPS